MEAQSLAEETRSFILKGRNITTKMTKGGTKVKLTLREKEAAALGRGHAKKKKKKKVNHGHYHVSKEISINSKIVNSSKIPEYYAKILSPSAYKPSKPSMAKLHDDYPKVQSHPKIQEPKTFGIRKSI